MPLASLLLVASLVGQVDAGPAPTVSAPTVSAPTVSAPTGLFVELDALYRARDVPGNADKILAQLEVLLEAATRTGADTYEIRWRIARICNWLGDGFPDDMKSKRKAVERGWRMAELAAKEHPERVEAQFWGAATYGQFAESAGVLEAALGGMGGKYEVWMKKAYAIDPGYEDHGPARALGRYQHMLPDFVGGSNARAIALLEESLQHSPDSLRGRLYLAEVLYDEGNKERARQELALCLAADPGRGDRADNVRMQQHCQALQHKLFNR